MTPRRSLAALLLGAALSACAPLPPSTPPAAARPAPAAANGPSARFIGFVGPKVQHDPPFLGIPDTNFYCLRSFLDRQTGETAHQLYVADSYFGAKRGWQWAHDAGGNALPFTPIGTDEIACDNGCSYAEEFAATIPAAALRASARGLAVTFTARSGATMTIVLSGEAIANQLAVVDAARRRVGPAAGHATLASAPEEARTSTIFSAERPKK